MKTIIVRKVILLFSLIFIILIFFSKIYSLIVDQFDRTNYCYMLMYGRIEEERGDVVCWKE